MARRLLTAWGLCRSTSVHVVEKLGRNWIGIDYFEFEKWALSLIAAQQGNLSKKGADRSIDGNVHFGKTFRAIVTVDTSDNIGIFLTLTPPTKPMRTEAAAAGLNEEPGFAPVPRTQIVTVEEALGLRDRAVRLPARRTTPSRRPPASRTGRRKARSIRRVGGRPAAAPALTTPRATVISRP